MCKNFRFYLFAGLVLFFLSNFLFILPAQSEEQKDFLIMYQSVDGARKNVHKIHFASESAAKARFKKLKSDPAVSQVEFGEPFRTLSIPNDSYYSNQWALSKISAPAAWDITTGSASNVIAFVDSGIDYTHQDLDGKIWENSTEKNGVAGVDDDGNGYVDDWRGWDFVGNDNDPKEEAGSEAGHGTATAGIAAAETNNGVGIAGIDWQAKIMVLRAMNPQGEGDPDNVALAIRYAADKGAKIINLSIGSPTDWSAVRNAVDYAYNKGSLLVAAAGNDGAYGISYPAKYSNVVAVGSSNSSDQRSSFSNYGPELDVLAPGENIYTTYWAQGYSNSYAVVSGTSASVPFVSGLASLIWADEPTLSSVQVFTKIRGTAEKISSLGLNSKTDQCGYGRINLLRALKIKLVKGSGPWVYLLDSGQKRWITSPYVFNSLGLLWEDIWTKSDSELPSVTGQPIYSFVKGSGSSVYLLDLGKKRHIVSPFIFERYGRWDQITTISNDLLATFSEVDALSWLLVKSSSRSEVYLVDSGTKHHIPDPFHFQLWGFRWGDIATLSDNAIDQIPTGANVTFLVKGSGSAVYFMDSGYKHWIINPSVFSDWGFRWDQIRTYSDDLVNTIWTGAPMTSLLKGSGSAVYLIENGYKHWLPNPDVFNRWRLNGTDIRPYSDLLVNAVYTGTPLSHLVKASNGRVYLVENGKRRWITSPRAFQNRGYKWSDVRTLPDSLINRLPEGQRIR